MNNNFKEYLKTRDEITNAIKENPENKDSFINLMMETDLCMIAHELERLNNILENMERKRR